MNKWYIYESFVCLFGLLCLFFALFLFVCLFVFFWVVFQFHTCM